MTSENQKSGIPPDKDALAIDLLIKRTAEGSADAFEELYRRLSPAVYAYALSTLRNRADAEDVLQNCFLALYRSAGGYTPDGRGRSYVMTIAHNLCMMQLRKRRNEAPSGEEPTLFSEDESSLSPYHHALLKECLTSLGDEERKILILHAVSGIKHREIADMLDLPLPTVLSKYHRAVHKLQKKFGKGE